MVDPWVSLASTPRCRERLADLAAGARPRVDVDARPQPDAAHGASRRARPGPRAAVQVRAELAGARLQLAVVEQADHGPADRAGQRVAAEGGAVLARPQHAEHVGVRDDGRDRHDAAAERLAEQVDVGDDALGAAREQVRRCGRGPTGSRRR